MMEYIRFALALIFVLGLVGACSWIGKRMGLTPRISGGGRNQRLGVIEVQAVDARRKLVLVRRDNIEHLILLNGDNDLLIESGIAGDRGHKTDDRKHPPSPPAMGDRWKEEDRGPLSSVIRPLSSIKP